MAAGQGWCAFCNSGMTVDEEFRQALIENRKGFTIDGGKEKARIHRSEKTQHGGDVDKILSHVRKGAVTIDDVSDIAEKIRAIKQERPWIGSKR